MIQTTFANGINPWGEPPPMPPPPEPNAASKNRSSHYTPFQKRLKATQKYLRGKGWVSRPAISADLGVSRTTTCRILDGLVAQGSIFVDNISRPARYRIKDAFK